MWYFLNQLEFWCQMSDSNIVWHLIRRKICHMRFKLNILRIHETLYCSCVGCQLWLFGLHVRHLYNTVFKKFPSFPIFCNSIFFATSGNGVVWFSWQEFLLLQVFFKTYLLLEIGSLRNIDFFFLFDGFLFRETSRF